jgi:hypothetical protein
MSRFSPLRIEFVSLFSAALLFTPEFVADPFLAEIDSY